MTSVRRGGVLLVSSLLLWACTTPPSALPPPTPTPTATASPSPTAAPSAAQAHVFVIVMENRSYQQALSMPYVAQLAARYGLATNYHAVSHPSLPNYLALTSGSTWGIGDDGYHPLPDAGLGSELSSSGLSWRAYMEGFTGDCYRSPYPYALKHNPFAYYGARCPASVVPMTRLAQDLRSGTPQLSWITPGLCHDGHDCSSAVADQWLASTVPQILASPAWQEDGVLYLTWDESTATSNQVPLLVIAPRVQKRSSGIYLDHFALAGTIADQLGVARPGRSPSSASIADAFGLPPSWSPSIYR